MIHEFPKLPYKHDALEPYIDAKTMEVHHEKHHRKYFDNFIEAISDSPELNEIDVKEILSKPEEIPERIREKVINNGGGFYNHSFFWEILAKDKKFDKNSEIGKAITEEFGSYENFKKELSNAAATLFGSGWAWLVFCNDSKKLEILQTHNQDSPVSINKVPLIGMDVWEHAYYLKYQNKRADYIEAFFNIINWEKVDELFAEAKQ